MDTLQVLRDCLNKEHCIRTQDLDQYLIHKIYSIYERIIYDYDPDNKRLDFHRALLHKMHKHYRELQKYLFLAIEYGNVIAMKTIGQQYQDLPDIVKMINYYKIAIEDYNDLGSKWILGHHYQIHGDSDEMKHYYRLVYQSGNARIEFKHFIIVNLIQNNLDVVQVLVSILEEANDLVTMTAISDFCYSSPIIHINQAADKYFPMLLEEQDRINAIKGDSFAMFRLINRYNQTKQYRELIEYLLLFFNKFSVANNPLMKRFVQMIQKFIHHEGMFKYVLKMKKRIEIRKGQLMCSRNLKKK